MSLGKTLRSYIWWTHERGSIHYDVMVTLILLFIFVGPIYIDFKDKPVHPAGVVVQPDGNQGFVYRIDAKQVKGTSDVELLASFKSVIVPIAGNVQIDRYQSVPNLRGRVIAWRVWVHRSQGN